MQCVSKDLLCEIKNAYFLGIGGVGMSALARLLQHRGILVSGSDKNDGKNIRALAHAGVTVFIGDDSHLPDDAQCVVYSSAIPHDHVDLMKARQKKVKIYHRAELLASLLNEAKTSIGISGTHGKTTTSSMISLVMQELGSNPTCAVGGDVLNVGTNALLGSPDLLIAEIDESDKSHELYMPNYVVLTNLEQDHVDHYSGLEDLKSSFVKFLKNAHHPGLIVFSGEDPVASEVVNLSGRPAVSFGFSERFDYFAENIVYGSRGCEFDFFETGIFAGRFKLSVPGRHNIANAMAALAVLLHLGLDLADVGRVLARFRGARRRLEVKAETPDFFVIDDYAHHPTEIRASIAALKTMAPRVTVIFQPHRFTRTGFFYREFAQALSEADEILLTDVYGAGEANPSHVGSHLIYDELVRTGHPAVEMMAKKDVLSCLALKQDFRGAVAFLGAGDIGEIANEFAGRCQNPVKS